MRSLRKIWPITLLNCDYKIAAAAIAARLGAPLGSVVDSSQTAFLFKRWIGDNVLAHFETLDYLRRAVSLVPKSSLTWPRRLTALTAPGFCVP